MTKARPRPDAPSDGINLSQAHWRKSSYSGGANDCVEIADLGRTSPFGTRRPSSVCL